MEEMKQRLEQEGTAPSWQANEVPTVKQTPEPQSGSGFMSFLGSVGKTAKSLATGALKGLGSTVVSTGELGTRTLGKLVGAQDVEGTTRMVESMKENELKPQNTAESIGFTAEQIGEFFVPAGGVGKATKAVEAVTKGNKLVKGATKLIPQITSDIGVTTLQSGGDTEEMSKAGAFSAVGGVAGKALSKGLSKIGDAFYSMTIPTTITERARDIGKGLETGKAVSETGVSLNRKSLLKKLGTKINTLGSRLESAVGQSNAERSIDDIVKDVKASFSEKEMSQALALSPIDLNEARVVVDETLGKYQDLYSGKMLTAPEQQKLKQEIGLGLKKVWDKTLGTPIRAQAFAEKKIYGELNGFLQKNVDGYEDINKQLAPLLEAKGRMTKKGAYSGYLTDVIAASMAGSTGGNVMDNPEAFFKNAIAGVLIKRGLTSTAAKTLSGQTAKQISKIVDRPEFYQLIRKATSVNQSQEVQE